MKDTKKLVTSAMLIAIGTVLALLCEYIPFLHLPFGGTIKIASKLPIILIAYMYGTPWGLFSAFVFSVIQLFIGGNTVSALFTPTSDSFMGIGIAVLVVLLDYILAFTVLGLGGIFRNKMKKSTAIILGTLLSMFLCYLFHVLSGAIFYGAWAEWFFTDTALADLGVSKWIIGNLKGATLATVYSLVYNACYMLPETVLTVIAAIPIARIPQIKKYE